MLAYLKRHWLKIFAAILLGAVGQGFWEYVLKPGLLSLTGLALSIATLGVESFKNSLYREIGRSFHEGPSLTLLNMTLGGTVGIWTGLITARFIRRSDRGPESQRRYFQVAAVYLTFVSAYLFIFSVRVSYVNRAITHFHQLSAISAPHLSDHHLVELRSQFGQIQSSADYAAVIEKLAETARSHGSYAPEFAVW